MLHLLQQCGFHLELSNVLEEDGVPRSTLTVNSLESVETVEILPKLRVTAYVVQLDCYADDNDRVLTGAVLLKNQFLPDFEKISLPVRINALHFQWIDNHFDEDKYPGFVWQKIPFIGMYTVDEQTHEDVSCGDEYENHNSEDETYGLDDDDNLDININDTRTHCIPFKVIGVLKKKDYQDVLEELSEIDVDLLRDVRVRLKPEPENEIDNNAIAFQVYFRNNWRRIGYVVKEITKYVHPAINHNLIISMKLEWVDYLTCWRNSGVGYFTSVLIEKKGEWPQEVIRVCSTR